MTIRIGLTFPGQGSQAPGMADGLLDVPLGKKLLAVCNDNNLDLATALGGDADALRKTDVAQPALFFTEVVLNSLRPAGFELLGAAGHSVGEYSALVGAGIMQPEVAMALVIKRGRAMATMQQGTMAAVLGMDLVAIEEICHTLNGTKSHVVVVANFNAPGQVVISGSVEAVAEASARAKERGAKKVVPLNVGGAFHSPLMAAAAEELGPEIDKAPMTFTKIPVVCNADGSAQTKTEEIRQRLRRQMASPVRWSDCVARLAGLGVDIFLEVGPGSVLTGLAKRIAPGVDAIAVNSPEAMAALPDQLGVKPR